MPIDASIALGVKPAQIDSPVNALARVLQIKGLQQDQELGAMKADEYRRGVADNNRLSAILSGGGGADEVQRAGLLKPALEIRKSESENAERAAKTSKDSADAQNKVISIYRDAIGSVRDPASAAEFVRTMHTDPRLKDSPIARVPLDQALAQIPQDPAQFTAWQQQFALGATKFMELNKPTITTRNTGGTTDTISTEGLTGKTSTVNSVKNTQSPDSAASIAEQRRAHDMADQRARDANAQGKTQIVETPEGYQIVDKNTGQARPTVGADGQPLKGKAADRVLTDTQAKALQFGSRMQAAEDVFRDLEQGGVTTSVPGSRAPVLGPVVNAFQPPDRQRLDQAKRDFINAALRRESGAAISPTEFDSAEKQYFPQPGETDAQVLAQKKANRELATRGILAEVPDSERRVASVRGKPAAPSQIDELLKKYGGK